MKRPDKLLMIYPYIEDFAAYDHFIQPLGLLTLAGHLPSDIEVHLINIPERSPHSKSHPDGTGPLPHSVIPAPDSIQDIPRDFKRFGMDTEDFLDRLRNLPWEPDVILLGSGMTYWYTGIETTVNLVKQVWPHIPILLGGIYATLLPEHASRRPGIDAVIPGQAVQNVLEELSRLWEVELPYQGWQSPRYDLINPGYFFAVQTAQGCVFHCDYCASPLLAPFEQFSPEQVAEMLLGLKKKTGINRFAFYDDALLFDPVRHIEVILKKILDSGEAIEFYTPNGLHIRFLEQTTAGLMYESGFKQIRLSLESIDCDFMTRHGLKNSQVEFQQALAFLRKAGFEQHQIHVYTLANVPGQSPQSVEKTMEWIFSQGAVPYLAFYSPVPGTRDYLSASGHTSLTDPLLHNNTVFLYHNGMDPQYYQHLRSLQNSYRRESFKAGI